ncbi:hypothetical protein PPYR_02255 [Photinus pyralis]|uniref:DDE Tnp4 domain-containing protein n=1 Tax=Photinus pyralis TaxID=7054 RepID=A0A5N4B6R3_PHOPY|nr:hypothetical protein PPYR_02255 [Photinus pyralis]
MINNLNRISDLFVKSLMSAVQRLCIQQKGSPKYSVIFHQFLLNGHMLMMCNKLYGQASKQASAVCDHKSRFTHCFVGHVGSVHDQRNPIKFPNDSHLIGDLAYKLHDNLLTPYRDNGYLTERQKNFNFCHSSARMSIERAFGLLKNRFRSLLTVLPMNNTHNVPTFVLACCVLHICLLKNDELEYTFMEEIQDAPLCIAPPNRIQAGLAKRDLISERLPMRLV